MYVVSNASPDGSSRSLSQVLGSAQHNSSLFPSMFEDELSSSSCMVTFVCCKEYRMFWTKPTVLLRLVLPRMLIIRCLRRTSSAGHLLNVNRRTRGPCAGSTERPLHGNVKRKPAHRLVSLPLCDYSAVSFCPVDYPSVPHVKKFDAALHDKTIVLPEVWRNLVDIALCPEPLRSAADVVSWRTLSTVIERLTEEPGHD